MTGDKISIGGALGLLHYLDYRPTHDVDAWWRPSVTARQHDQVVEVIEAALRPHGQVSGNSVVVVRGPEWREAVDTCRLLTSPSYHLLRTWHDLPALPYLGQDLAYIRDDPNLAYV